MKKETALFQRMNEIADKFNHSLEYLHGELEYMLSDEGAREEFVHFVGVVYRSYASCSDDEKLILNYDFIGEKKPKGWWKKKFTEEAYRKTALDAVVHFLGHYDSEMEP